MPYIQITEDGVVSKLEWTPNPQVKFDRKKMPKVAPLLTLGQEVEEAVRTWYRLVLKLSTRRYPKGIFIFSTCR